MHLILTASACMHLHAPVRLGSDTGSSSPDQQSALKVLSSNRRALSQLQNYAIQLRATGTRGTHLQLSRRLRAISATRAAQRSGEPVTIVMDPREP